MHRLLKRILISLGTLAVLFIAGALVFRWMERGLSDLVATEIEDVDLAAVEDGVYEGSYTRLPVSATVRVTVVDHAIATVEIVEHVNGQGADGEAVVDAVIAENSLAVDAIAGATYSSKVILLAIRDALVAGDRIE
ncbi:MAG: FMN-binding protein [Candidatus Izemoplasmatales bacterium]